MKLKERVPVTEEADDIQLETESATARSLKPGLPTLRPLRWSAWRRPGRARWLVPCAFAALAVALALVNQRHEADAEGGAEAQREVVAHVEALLSYDYREIEADLERELDWLGGSFADEYSSLVREQILPAAEKAEVTTDARVAASGVVEAGDDHVELLVFVNVTTRSDQLPEPRVAGSRLVITADRTDGEWRITALDPV